MSLLYRMLHIDNTGQGLEKKYNSLIIAAGSDYRAYEILRKLKSNNIEVENVYLFNFYEREEKLKTSDKDAYNEYKKLASQIIEIKCGINNPSDCIKSLSDQGFSISSNEKIAMDITSFTEPYFLSLLKFLKEKINSISVFYTEPWSYIFSGGLNSTYKSSYGPLSVIEVPGYPGLNTGKTKILIILLGFDGDLSSFISEQVSPNDIILINGFPSYSPTYKDISIINNERLINNSKTTLKYSRAINPFETYNILEDILEDYKQSDIFFNIAPLGTKPMTLGACLFAIKHPSVRIVYPQPEWFVNKTTRKCGFSWLYDIPLS